MTKRQRARAWLLALVAVSAVVLTTLSLSHLQPSLTAGGAEPDVGAGAASPSLSPRVASSCRPTEVYPLKCGTYESTFGGKEVTGRSGGPKEDPLQISFTRRDGQLLLLAGSDDCWSATVPMRLVEDKTPGVIAGQQLAERAGATRFTTIGCTTDAALAGHWAYAFLRGALITSHAESFGRDDTAVFFQYQGIAPIGQRQLARNDLKCIPAHITPFTCRAYRSTSGTGSLAFLDVRPFRLTFAHNNGDLTATLFGRCNAMSTELQRDGGTVVATGGSTGTMGCPGTRARDDDAVGNFFRGTITYTQRGDVIIFSSPRGSATFQK